MYGNSVPLLFDTEMNRPTQSRVPNSSYTISGVS